MIKLFISSKTLARISHSLLHFTSLPLYKPWDHFETQWRQSYQHYDLVLGGVLDGMRAGLIADNSLYYSINNIIIYLCRVLKISHLFYPCWKALGWQLQRLTRINRRKLGPEFGNILNLFIPAVQTFSRSFLCHHRRIPQMLWNLEYSSQIILTFNFMNNHCYISCTCNHPVLFVFILLRFSYSRLQFLFDFTLKSMYRPLIRFQVTKALGNV